MAKQVETEIEELAQKMVKSTADSKQLLFNTVMELGAEGLKKALPNLSEEQKELLQSCLEDFEKAIPKVQDEMTPKKTETKASDMKQESLSGSDDEDENKLMDPKNAQHPHQGGPKDKPEGWSGEVIKGETPATKKLIELEEAEHKIDINGDGKIAEKLEKDKKMKKALEEIVGLAKSLKMTKEEVVKAIKDAKEDLALVKSDMEAKKKLLAEESQVKPTDQTEGKKEKIPEDKGELEIKSEQTPEEIKIVKKSVNWQMKNTLGANTLGRNTHWDVDAYIVKSEEEKQDTIKKGAYFGEKEVEKLQKSETEKADINDLIEKGFDYSTEEIQRLEGIRTHKVEGKVVKSFHDIEIARALGMSDEEYKKLMGE